MLRHDYYLEQHGEKSLPKHRDGTAYVSTFPFWIIVRRGEQLGVLDVAVDGVALRVYPPFRSAPANQLPLPPLVAAKIPFLPGAEVAISRDYEITQVSVVPDLTTGRDTVLWGEEFGDSMGGIPMDALRVDTFHEKNRTRIELQTRLLGLIRWHTGQWWIGRSLEGLIGTTRAAFAIRKDGSPLSIPMPCASTTELLGSEECLDAELWGRIGSDLLAGRSAPFAANLLMDARLHRARGETRRAILDAAIACEHKATSTIRRFVEARGARFRAGRFLQGPGLPDYVSSDLERVSGHSYSSAGQARFELIKKLWDARGKIAHGAAAEYRSDGRVYPVTDERLATLLGAAEHLLGWLADLDA